MSDLYGKIKAGLARRKETPKHFTREFLELFVSCYDNAEQGITDAYAPIYDTAFYKEESGAYCEFLSIFLDSYCKKFRIELFDGPMFVQRFYDYFSTEARAREAVKRKFPQYFCEIMAVA